ncbi:hypothetical protein C7999DRAFT_37856 [Corynascus novoguineensis]|uniref:G-protein coupled receptors family 2 profile 2 domain-containing protein n=1 Tax=Corynascus novoguineensis TaxID=1126955 RepID=A0AAN7D260_9PEZI|nr:hypothetical protein C7999DRAFT_37856 [Corynascus novoguineensis]
MANTTFGCPSPFLLESDYPDEGYWAYPDSFGDMTTAANWVAVVSTVCCVFLLLSWAVLPVEKTYRHYLSISLTVGVVCMNLGFVIPLAGNPEQCYDDITPNSMSTQSVCAASGFFIIFGGWAGVMWIFLRALSLHLQICWQLVVGRNFMWFAQAVGWGIPVIGVIIAFILSGVSFRFGPTCHINHKNSLADLWIPLLVFAALTIIIQFATFGYCIKVYLASLADNSASTEGSGMPSYTNSIRTMTPKQAYRRVRRVIALQWRGIAIVLIIVADVIFFSIIFVFADNTVESAKNDPTLAMDWLACLFLSKGDKSMCLDEASSLTVSMPTIGAVLFLLGMNGIWLLLLLGRWSMFTGWRDMLTSVPSRNQREFVSVDARLDDLKKDTRSYEMLSRDTGKTMDDSVTPSVVTPISPTHARSTTGSPINHDYVQMPNTDGRRTPDYFGNTARYHAPARSFSSPRAPQTTVTWDARETYARPTSPYTQQQQQDRYMNPLGMNRI